MSAFKVLRGAGVAACAAVAVLAVLANGAFAAALKVCVPEKEATAIVTPKAGVCKAKYTATTLLPEAIVSHINYVEKGVGGKPTIQFSGVNVQVVNGEGKTESANAEGNLVIGYDESPQAQTGSHNLVLGEVQRYTSFGSIVGGVGNTVTGTFSVVFGSHNVSSGSLSSVTGGELNEASGGTASVSGGHFNTASGRWASVFGGAGITASGEAEAKP